MRDADDTTTGGPIVALHRCTCGAEVTVPLTGTRCHGCGRQHAMGAPEVDEQAALSELPGGQRRRGSLEDV